MKKSFAPEIKIAIVTIIALAIIYFGINFLKGLNIVNDKDHYFVKLPDVSGLTVSSEVLADGFPIGIVKSMSYDYKGTGKVTVEIEVQKGMRVPEGSHVELTKEMLGATKMNLVLGGNNSMQDKLLNVGDTIFGGWKQDALSMAGELIPQFQALTPKIDSILISLNTLLANPALAGSLENAQYLTENLKTTTNELNKLLAKDVPAMAKKGNGIMDDIHTTTSLLNSKISALDMEQLSYNANNAIRNFNELSSKIDNPNSSLGKLMNDDALYTHIDSTIQSTNALLIDFREHPKRYVHFSVFGKKDK